MNVDKIIVKAFLGTLAAIGALFVFLFVALVGIYPETMQEITYDLGMDTPCIWFAERTYKRHGKIDDIALAMEVAIADGNDKKVISCGKKMITDEEFIDYCEEKTLQIKESAGNNELVYSVLGEYDEYVYGQIVLSQYRLNKKSEAITSAIEWTGNAFPKNNAIVRLLVEAKKDKDEQTLQTLISKMKEISIPSEDSDYYNEILAYAETPLSTQTNS